MNINVAVTITVKCAVEENLSTELKMVKRTDTESKTNNQKRVAKTGK